jgi:hypothetical protein
MAKDDRDRPVNESEKDQADQRQEQDGQVSEMAQPEPVAGGADATDKSTGTAADRADQPAE